MSELYSCPMLATDAPEDLNELDYTSLWASKKYDGVRARNIGGVLLSRRGELIPNKKLQRTYGVRSLHLFDGELYSPQMTPHEIQSVVSSADADVPDHLQWYVFDYDVARPFTDRKDLLIISDTLLRVNNCVPVPHIQMYHADDLRNFADIIIESGGEGACIRDGRMHYLHGRSTVDTQTCLRIKSWETFEGTITGMTRRLANENLQERNNIGYAKRSKSKDGMVELDEVGAFDVKAIWNGKLVRFSVGAGPLGREECVRIWNAGLPAVFRKQCTIKAARNRAKNLPSQPVLVCIRWEGDL